MPLTPLTSKELDVSLMPLMSLTPLTNKELHMPLTPLTSKELHVSLTPLTPLTNKELDVSLMSLTPLTPLTNKELDVSLTPLTNKELDVSVGGGQFVQEDVEEGVVGHRGEAGGAEVVDHHLPPRTTRTTRAAFTRAGHVVPHAHLHARST
ncbi:hypothetical protein HAZT_HAZT007444 [Hyalella azteca]|uniref:Uncharacterized protein n=1 Tax=Hyalella azteca TaxID=294128 RepID=A0A6A0H2Y8_HYAAZ|nr:hypothetical protein HAZT_HAZT007444 [Hyalella azteca]